MIPELLVKSLGFFWLKETSPVMLKSFLLNPAALPLPPAYP